MLHSMTKCLEAETTSTTVSGNAYCESIIQIVTNCQTCHKFNILTGTLAPMYDSFC